MSFLPPLRRSVGLRRVRFGRRAAGLRRFRPDVVITEHSHEYFLVDGLPGIVEQRRDALDVTEFRTLPGNNDQRLGRFLIAQNGHAERLSAGHSDQLSVFVLLWLRIVSLCWWCFRR